MVFKKYKVLNDCIGNLVAGINASTTSLTLGTGEGTSFPGITSGEFAIGTLVQYNTPADPTSGVAKKERVLISNKSGDIFTITRGQFGTTGTSFLAGDYFYINIVADIITDIQDEVKRLEIDKLNKNGQLRTGNGTWKVIYNNGSGDETELALGDSGKILRSNGVNQPPTFETPTVDIIGLAEDTTGNIVNDFFIKNNGTGNNTKIKISRYMATDGETTTGTNETKFINPKQAKDNYELKTDVINITRNTSTASNTVTYSHGLGKIPKKIDLFSFAGDSRGLGSSGSYANGKNYCSYYSFPSSIIVVTQSTLFSVAYSLTNNTCTGVIQNLTTTTFDIVWTKTNSPTETMYITATLIA